MASPYVYDALKAFIETEFSPVPVIDFDAVENTLKQGTDPFIVLEETAGADDNIAFGNDQEMCQRESGVMVCHFLTPAPESSDTARTLAQQISDALRMNTIDGVRIVNVSPPDVERMNEGLWTAGATVISYQYDSIHVRN